MFKRKRDDKQVEEKRAESAEEAHGAGRLCSRPEMGHEVYPSVKNG